MTENTDLLLIRMDRIGDLILTLPVDQQEGWSHTNTTWLVNTGMNFLMDSTSPKRNYQTVDKKFSFVKLFNLIRTIKKIAPQKSIVFHAPWWIGLALFLARVPVRTGRKSQWHSFLFFNQGLRQKRSLSEKHEYEYNLDLVKLVLPLVPLKRTNLSLKPLSQDPLRKFSLEAQNYFIVHPGMNGSALNWPSENYIKLIKKLSLTSKVVITGTATDKLYLDPIKKELHSHENIIWLDEQVSGQELICLAAFSKAVVAPSTGVAHIAASTGVKTVGLYSNVVPEAAQRWGPLGKNVTVLSPNSKYTTLKNPEVMREILVSDVIKTLEQP